MRRPGGRSNRTDELKAFERVLRFGPKISGTTRFDSGAEMSIGTALELWVSAIEPNPQRCALPGAPSNPLGMDPSGICGLNG